MARSKVVHNSQIFTTGLAFRIKIRHLSNSDSPVATACTKPIVITSCRVENASVIPNCYVVISIISWQANIYRTLTNIIGLVPLETDLEIMPIGDQVVEPL